MKLNSYNVVDHKYRGGANLVVGKLKTPIGYYGGKQSLAVLIADMFPEHKLYCEPFLGGGAVFFAKKKSVIEVINDINAEIPNFFRVAKTRYPELKALIDGSLHSRRNYADARVMYNNPHLFTETQRAWALWTLSNCSFLSKLNGTYAADKNESRSLETIAKKRDWFTEEFCERLKTADIECVDAVYLIKARDSKNAFFYCDPPYFNSDCGHYKGYKESDFRNLLEALSNIKGKFLLSSFESKILEEYTEKNGWKTLGLKTYSPAKGHNGVACFDSEGKRKLNSKIEMLTYNYELPTGDAAASPCEQLTIDG